MYKHMTNLRRIRLKKELTQLELATLTNIKLSTLQKLDKGSNNINKASVDTVLALAKVLDCSIEDLLETEDETDSKATGKAINQ